MVLWVGLQQSALVISARCAISWSYRLSADDFIVSEASEGGWDMDGSGARPCAHVCVFRAEEGGTSKGAGRQPLIKLIQVGAGGGGACPRPCGRCSGHPARQQPRDWEDGVRMTIMKDFPVKWFPAVLPLRRDKQKASKGAKSNKKGTGLW